MILTNNGRVKRLTPQEIVDRLLESAGPLEREIGKIALGNGFIGAGLTVMTQVHGEEGAWRILLNVAAGEIDAITGRRHPVGSAAQDRATVTESEG